MATPPSSSAHRLDRPDLSEVNVVTGSQESVLSLGPRRLRRSMRPPPPSPIQIDKLPDSTDRLAAHPPASIHRIFALQITCGVPRGPPSRLKGKDPFHRPQFPLSYLANRQIQHHRLAAQSMASINRIFSLKMDRAATSGPPLCLPGDDRSDRP